MNREIPRLKNDAVTPVLFLLAALFLAVNVTFAQTYDVTRLNGGAPIVTEEMFTALGASEREGQNMNGPSVIRIPKWIPSDKRADRTAEYYMYFAHHGGDYIRMAWAAKVEGPWHLYRVGEDVEVGTRGVLDLGPTDAPRISEDFQLRSHVSSPNIHIDEENRRIAMYFHAGSYYKGERLPQYTFLAHSDTGLDFNSGIIPARLGGGYPRVFEHNGNLYAFGFGGQLYQAPSASNPVLLPPNQSPEQPRWPSVSSPFDDAFAAARVKTKVRHVGVFQRGDTLEVFFTAINQTPERIQLVKIGPGVSDVAQWTPSLPAEEILRAERDWEGADLPVTTSEGGPAPENLNQIRDPHVFENSNGSLYLFYVGRGEDALGLARLTPRD